MLFHVSKAEKFYSFVKKENIKKAMLDTIIKYGLTRHENDEECIVKFNGQIVVRAKGDYSMDFIEGIKNTIAEINSTANKIYLVYATKDTLLPDVGVYFTFKRDTLLPYSNQCIVKNKSMWGLRFPGMVKADIQITFKNTRDMQLSIANSLFQAVCLQSESDNFFIIDKGTIHLKPFYKDVLKTYYNPTLSQGFTKKELEWVITKIKGE